MELANQNAKLTGPDQGFLVSRLVLTLKPWERGWLYSLRVLRRASVEQRNILKVHLTTIRPVPIWQAIPDYLIKRLESIQRRALRIIFPSIDSNDQAMMMAQVPTLESI